MRSRLSLVLALSLILLLALSGCGSGGSTKTLANGESIKMLTNVVGGKNPQEDKLFAKAIKQLTGIQVDMVHPTAGYSQKLLAAMGSGEKYDVVYLTEPQLKQLKAQGALLDLTKRVKNSKVLSNPKVVSPKIWNNIKTSDGHIYGVPVKYSGGLLPIVRKDWMEKLHLQQPKTLNDFYKVLKAFKDDDPDGDGKNDTYGLTLSEMYDIQPFMSAVGLRAGYVTKNGKRTIPYSTEKAVPVYKWLHKLYKQKILDAKFVTNSTEDERNLFLSNKVGMFVYWDAWVPMLNNLEKQAHPNSKFFAEGIPGAVGPNGKILLLRGDPSLWAIPKNAPHPDTAFKFLEWWNTKPGEILGSLGIKGHDYTVKNGKYTLTKVGKEHNMDHGDPQPTDSQWKNPIGQQQGYANARAIVSKYGKVRDTGTKWDEAQKIIWHYGEQAVLGKMSAESAVKAMHRELLSQHLIDG